MHLPPYANKSTKESILCLSGSKGFCVKLLEADYYRGKDRADQHLKIAAEHLQLAINEMCRGLDEHQLRGIIRFADGITLTVTPSSSPTTEQEDFIVSRDALKVFLQSPTSDCAFCSLSGKEARDCKVRQALLESLVIPRAEDGDCPYKL